MQREYTVAAQTKHGSMALRHHERAHGVNASWERAWQERIMRMGMVWIHYMRVYKNYMWRVHSVREGIMSEVIVWTHHERGHDVNAPWERKEFYGGKMFVQGQLKSREMIRIAHSKSRKELSSIPSFLVHMPDIANLFLTQNLGILGRDQWLAFLAEKPDWHSCMAFTDSIPF